MSARRPETRLPPGTQSLPSGRPAARPHFALAPWAAQATPRGGARAGRPAGSLAVRGGGGGGAGDDGDMESGAYGAAKAGGSFDLRRYLTQPQVVVRAVCTVSGPGRRRREDSTPPQAPRGRREPTSATGGGFLGLGVEEGRWAAGGWVGGGACRAGARGRGPPSPPPRSTPGLRRPQLQPWAGAPGGREVPWGAGPSTCWQWEELGAVPGQVTGTPRLELGGIHPEGVFRGHVGCRVWV